jgi:RNA polymerase sigma-70 factor (ECF subfamily)
MNSDEPGIVKFSVEENKKHVSITPEGVNPPPPTNFSQKSEEQIWSEFKAGHRGALTHIYQKYVNQLFNYGCQFTSNHHLVKDCIQELFILIIRKKENLGDTDCIRAYLFKSFRWRLVKMMEKEAKVTGKYEKKGFFIEISPELNFIRDQLSRQQSLLLEKHINALPERQKEAILLYFYEGIPYSQIAEILHMTKTKSARALLYRAIETLSKHLKPYKDTLTAFFAFVVCSS